MIIDDLKLKLEHYSHLTKRKINKALMDKIEYIPSFTIFNETMFTIGIQQRYKQYAMLVIEKEYFIKNKHLFKLNNKFKLSKQSIVFANDTEEKAFKIPKNTYIKIWTRIKNVGSVNSRTRYLEVAYIVNDELYFINKRDI